MILLGYIYFSSLRGHFLLYRDSHPVSSVYDVAHRLLWHERLSRDRGRCPRTRIRRSHRSE